MLERRARYSRVNASNMDDCWADARELIFMGTVPIELLTAARPSRLIAYALA